MSVLYFSRTKTRSRFLTNHSSISTQLQCKAQVQPYSHTTQLVHIRDAFPIDSLESLVGMSDSGTRLIFLGARPVSVQTPTCMQPMQWGAVRTNLLGTTDSSLMAVLAQLRLNSYLKTKMSSKMRTTRTIGRMNLSRFCHLKTSAAIQFTSCSCSL